MDALTRLAGLSAPMNLEPDGEPGSNTLTRRQQDAICISQAQMPNGRQITMLKTLLTSACERNCFYCPFRSGRDFHRATLTPDEMAGAFMAIQRAGVAQGIFLSSGIAAGGLRTQDRLLATAEILRQKYRFPGYVHLKLMPGAEKAQVERAMQLADRVSLNLEAPNSQRLEKLAPTKVFLEELLQPLRWVHEIRSAQPASRGWQGRWPSMTTQFVVGAAGESDLELLSTTAALQTQLGLARAYFSAFNPIPDTPLENLPAEAPLRQHRLYQASFLLRDYGFGLEDLPFQSDGGLPRDVDPKTAWARQNIAGAPLEVNRAGRNELLRIPGIGPRSADAILNARCRSPLRSLDDLRHIGIRPDRAAPYILLDGRQAPRQLSLW